MRLQLMWIVSIYCALRLGDATITELREGEGSPGSVLWSVLLAAGAAAIVVICLKITVDADRATDQLEQAQQQLLRMQR